jgi:hypothetical protein
MRKLVFLLGPVVAAATVFACEGSSNPAAVDIPAAGSFEAGPLPEAGPTPDGAPADAADASLGTSVTVNVLRGGAPAAGVLIVFHDAAGVVLETKATGADGKATSTPGATPGQATALLGGGTLRRILTWTAVELGDELFVEDVTDATTAGQYDVTLQGDFSDGGAASANASIGTCTENALGSNVLIGLTPQCLRPTSSILARAVDANTQVIAYAFKKANPAPLDAGTATATVGPWLTPSKITITPVNLPMSTPSVFASLAEISDGLAFRNATGGGLGRLNNATFDVAPGFADAYQAGLRMGAAASSSATLLVAKRGAPAANTDIDVATALPALATAALDGTDPARPQVSWTTVGGASLASTDGGSIAIRWFDTRSDDRSWTFVVAPGATSVKAPAMPAAADAWLPHPAQDGGAASSFAAPEVTFVESDLLAGYKALRRDVGRLVPLEFVVGRDAHAVLPAAGTLRATSLLDVAR